MVFKRRESSLNPLKNFAEIEFFYEIVDSFVLDMCSKLKNCSERQKIA